MIRPGAAVAGVDDHLQRLEPGASDVAEQVLEIACARMSSVRSAPGLRRLRRQRACSISARMSFRPVSALIGRRLLAHELHAVVVGRIVAGGHHDAAVELLGEGGEIHALGAAQADVGDVHAASRSARASAPPQLRAGQADVVADRHALGLDEARHRPGRCRRPAPR